MHNHEIWLNMMECPSWHRFASWKSKSSEGSHHKDSNACYAIFFFIKVLKQPILSGFGIDFWDSINTTQYLLIAHLISFNCCIQLFVAIHRPCSIWGEHQQKEAHVDKVKDQDSRPHPSKRLHWNRQVDHGGVQDRQDRAKMSERPQGGWGSHCCNVKQRWQGFKFGPTRCQWHQAQTSGCVYKHWRFAMCEV